MLFGRGEHTLEPNDNEVIDQVHTDVRGPPAHVILLEMAHAIRNSAFDFALRFHGLELYQTLGHAHAWSARNLKRCGAVRYRIVSGADSWARQFVKPGKCPQPPRVQSRQSPRPIRS